MNEHINDGGPAFPLATIDGYSTGGMTLRDYFAAKVMGAFAPRIADEAVRTGSPQYRSGGSRSIRDSRRHD